MTPLEVYKMHYSALKTALLVRGITEDAASRKANICAIQHNWFLFNNLAIFNAVISDLKGLANDSSKTN